MKIRGVALKYKGWKYLGKNDNASEHVKKKIKIMLSNTKRNQFLMSISAFLARHALTT